MGSIMLIESTREFADYVELLYQQQKGERIYPFEYAGKKYWLKQPEILTGVERLLKPYPQKLFQEELRTLLYLDNKHAPVARLLVATENYLVLEDVGKTLNHILPNKSAVEKQNILRDAALALINLHKMGLVHGRPAIRDIAWDNGEVRFIDLEDHSHTRDLNWKKKRDVLVFLHGLCRTKELSDDDIVATIHVLADACEPIIWEECVQFLTRYRWLYYLLLPFKPIARKDLLAVYRLFELVKGKK